MNLCRRVWMGAMLAAAAMLLAGCAEGPHILPAAMQRTVDRRVSEYPTGFALKPYLVGLDAPTGMCFDEGGNLIIAQNGPGGNDPRIFGFRPNGTEFDIWPQGHQLPILNPTFHIFGPIGAVVCYHGHVYVSHRDSNDMGVITRFGYDGSHTTIVAGLPAQGDYSVTDLAISPVTGRIYFGLGTTTNSGVVGPDNWEEGWVRKHPEACDSPAQSIRLLGYRFSSLDPDASVFLPELQMTVSFCPYGVSNLTVIPASPFGKPTGAIYSISPDAGDLRVEAWGVRDPVGLAVNEFGRVYFTDRGMELRGTRPIADDPDVLFRLVPGGYYGWPDYSRSLDPISDPQFQPPTSMVIPSGYPDVGFLIDHQASNLPDPNRQLITATFKPLSGAAKMDFFPASGPFNRYNGDLVVAMWGDQAPFATNHQALKMPLPGYKLVRVDPDGRTVTDFVYNIMGGPASGLSEGRNTGLERPIDVKFGPDGNLYILDYGRIQMKDGHQEIAGGTGKIFRLVPVKTPEALPARQINDSDIQP